MRRLTVLAVSFGFLRGYHGAAGQESPFVGRLGFRDEPGTRENLSMVIVVMVSRRALIAADQDTMAD